MARHLTMVEDHLEKLNEWWVPRTKNSKVNVLAGIVATLLIRETIMLLVYLQGTSSITPEQVCNAAKVNLSWMHDIMKYL